MQYTKKDIVKINNSTIDFYNKVHDSFSATRQFEWDGWNKCLPYIEEILSKKDNLKILDLGCGNLRFEKFINSKFPDKKINVLAVDNNEKLLDYAGLNDNIEVDFCNIDIINSLLENHNNFKNKKFDLVVAFGLFHHIPGEKLRNTLINHLYDCLDKDSYLIISFWQFLNDEKLKNKAYENTELAKEHLELNALEENDYFLSWQKHENVFRFCHNFSYSDINAIKNNNDFKNIAEFIADGKYNNLNKYLVISNG